MPLPPESDSQEGSGTGQIWENIGGLDQAAADAIVHRALDAGINFIDTADVYSAGESETMVGKAIAGKRGDLVLATKVRGRMGQGPNQVGLSRLHIMNSVEASLKRLGEAEERPRIIAMGCRPKDLHGLDFIDW